MSYRVDTVLPADSVEFCPYPGLASVFAVGTYKLEEGARRWGKCLLFEVDSDDEMDQWYVDEIIKHIPLNYPTSRQVQEISMAAILDMKWSCNVLAIADSESQISLYKLSEKNHSLHLVENICASPDSLCLSLDWAKDRNGISSDKLATSCSNGSIAIAKCTDSGLLVTNTWIGHEFEPWITAWNRWDQNVLYTGGDDCKLKGWDCRVGYETPILMNTKFDGGVTTIQSNPHEEHVLAVGSYDGIVRIFDARRFSKPVTQVTVGGGAWRVKWHHDPVKKNNLLIACMHSGFKVTTFNKIQISEINQGVISSHFDEHDSLAYGVDWSYAPSTKNGSLVGSCSFYDHQLRLWRA